MIWWTGLAPWEFEWSFPGSLTSTFLALTPFLRTLTERAAQEQGESSPREGGLTPPKQSQRFPLDCLLWVENRGGHALFPRAALR